MAEIDLLKMLWPSKSLTLEDHLGREKYQSNALAHVEQIAHQMVHDGPEANVAGIQWHQREGVAAARLVSGIKSIYMASLNQTGTDPTSSVRLIEKLLADSGAITFTEQQ